MNIVALPCVPNKRALKARWCCCGHHRTSCPSHPAMSARRWLVVRACRRSDGQTQRGGQPQSLCKRSALCQLLRREGPCSCRLSRPWRTFPGLLSERGRWSGLNQEHAITGSAAPAKPRTGPRGRRQPKPKLRGQRDQQRQKMRLLGPRVPRLAL